MIGHQLYALLWKNTLLRFRSWGSCAVEIVMPLLLCLLVVYGNKGGGGEASGTQMTAPKSILPDNVFEKTIYYKPSSAPLERLVKSWRNSDFEIEPLGDREYISNQSAILVEFLGDTSNSVPTRLAFQTATSQQYTVNELYGALHKHSDKLVPFTQYFFTKLFINYWQEKNKRNTPKPNLKFYLWEMPQKITSESRRNNALQSFTAFLLFLFFGLAALTTQYILQEKESKIKESMKLMGLTTFSFWLAWFLTSFFFGMVVCLFVMVCFSTRLLSETLLTSQPWLLLCCLSLYVTDVISFSFMVSCFLSKERFAGILSGVLFILHADFSVLTFSYLNTTKLAHIGGIFVFQSGFQHFIHILRGLEEREIGVNVGSMFNYEVIPHLNVLDTMIMMTSNTLFNFFIVWYMDTVYPGEYGVSRPFNFFLTKEYWCSSVMSSDAIPELPEQDKCYFEPPTSNLQPGIQVRGLVKVFKGFVAVAGTSMDLYKEQITVLLGHNGAGKTTTINMITGFLKPDKGTAIINGYDITKNLAKARSCIGLCPQHDILFPKLTCYEHLKFYSMLKGHYDSKTVCQDIDKLLVGVGLGEKHSSYSQVLSGGQKRKLSVACAFVGSTKIVFLDEPSSGLDPSARRDLWAFLKNRRQGRTILLTTHYMDEADVLGDRIVIMAEGVVKCCGSSNFLKKIYGTGYQMSIVKGPKCNVIKVTNVIKKHIPEAKFSHETNAEIFYVLPDDDIRVYPKMLHALEKDKTNLSIESFGLEATSMEDVFVRVGKGFQPKRFLPNTTADVPSVTFVEKIASSTAIDDENMEAIVAESDTTSVKTSQSDKSSQPKSESNTGQPMSESANENSVKPAMTIEKEKSNEHFERMSNYTKLVGFPLFRHQLKAIFYKKTILFARNKLSSIGIILLPVILTSLGIKSDLYASQNFQSPRLNFTLDRFPSDLVFPVFYEANGSRAVVDAYREIVHGRFGTVVEHTIESRKELPKKVLEITKDVRVTMYKEKYLFGLFETSTEIYVFYHDSVVHSQGIAMQLALEAWVHRSLGKSFSVQTGVQHIPSKVAKQISTMQLTTLLSLGFSMALMPVIFIYPLISERAEGARHLQSLSGVSPIAYWLGTFQFDMLTYLVSIFLLMAAFQFNPSVYIAQSRWALTLIILIVFGFATFPYLYVVQLFFNSPGRAVSVMIMITTFIGILLSFGMLTLRSFMLFTSVKVEALHWFLTIVCPNYSLTALFFYIPIIALTYKEDDKGFLTELIDYLQFGSFRMKLSEPLYSLLTVCVVSWVSLCLLEHRVHRLVWYSIPFCNFESFSTKQEDEDVTRERQMIRSTPLKELKQKYALVMVNLQKVFFARFNLFVAVHSTSLALAANECFGLLGQNGAGKSTTFKMLTGDVTITSGAAYIDGLSVKTRIKSIQAKMGYCPQHDALHDTLTGLETLYLYARLRGVPEESLEPVVQAVVDFVSLAPHETKQTRFYSGGNKRKLSVGISIIGNPKLIMLDEPTAGMDPMARRILWNVLHLIRASGKNLFLTSHSMEECEALCTRIAIMVRGRVVCLGSVQHLKSKYGEGYTVILHAAKNITGASASLDEAVKFVLKEFDKSKIFTLQESYVDIQVPKTVLLSTIFAVLEAAKKQFRFEHYTVQQASLEQVFLRFMLENEA